MRVCRLVRTFPTEERYGLTSQLRRAALAVPINIAEGAKRRTDRDFAHFVNIAESSLAEVDYELLASKELGYASPEDHAEIATMVDACARMLTGLRKRLEGQRR